MKILEERYLLCMEISLPDVIKWSKVIRIIGYCSEIT